MTTMPKPTDYLERMERGVSEVFGREDGSRADKIRFLGHYLIAVSMVMEEEGA